MSLIVDQPGPMSLVQDLGRHGYGHLGISTSGAADRRSHRLANRLVGNDEDAATIEILFGGFRAHTSVPLTIALTGAPAPLLVNGTPAALYEPVFVPAGGFLTLGYQFGGLRNYLAVRGGFEPDAVLGSRSTDPTTGIGPAPLTASACLPIGVHPDTPLPGIEAPCSMRNPDEVTLRVMLGPRDDWFAPTALRALETKIWQVSAEGDRVGVRLNGPSLTRSIDRELPSEGTVRGAIQVPPSGQPLVFLSDHPTTGGYPVIGVVVEEDVDLLAQTRPGSEVRFLLSRPSLR